MYKRQRAIRIDDGALAHGDHNARSRRPDELQPEPASRIIEDRPLACTERNGDVSLHGQGAGEFEDLGLGFCVCQNIEMCIRDSLWPALIYAGSSGTTHRHQSRPRKKNRSAFRLIPFG